MTRRVALGWLSVAVFVGRSASAEAVKESDSRISVETVSIPAVDGLRGYLARPKTPGKRPGIVLVHDKDGLNAHAKDTARRLAVAGYVVLALDCVSAENVKTPENLIRLSTAQMMGMGQAGVALLRERQEVGGKIGTFGIGWGGAAANHLAFADRSIAAVVAYYGQQPIYYQEDNYRAITAKFLHHYAGRDQITNQGIDIFTVSLTDVGKMPESHIYPLKHRGFDDDSSPHYDKAAADLAWQRTAAFLKKNLG